MKLQVRLVSFYTLRSYRSIKVHPFGYQLQCTPHHLAGEQLEPPKGPLVENFCLIGHEPAELEDLV